MTIPVPTFGHTPLVDGNLENGYDEATTGRRFEKTRLICSHGRVGCVPGPQRRGYSNSPLAETSLFTSFGKLFWNFASFFL